MSGALQNYVFQINSIPVYDPLSGQNGQNGNNDSESDQFEDAD